MDIEKIKEVNDDLKKEFLLSNDWEQIDSYEIYLDKLRIDVDMTLDSVFVDSDGYYVRSCKLWIHENLEGIGFEDINEAVVCEDENESSFDSWLQEKSKQLKEDM